MASKVGGMIQKISTSDVTYGIASTAYGECETAINTAAKTVAMTGFTLLEGTTVHIKFINGNSATDPTLNIQSTGTKPIIGTSDTNWNANEVVEFTYDGASWICNTGSSLGIGTGLTKESNNIVKNYRGIEYIRGEWTANTNVWVATSTDNELYDGKQILLYMPYSGNGSNVTLNLNLADGTTTGAKNVYYESTTRFTTHKSAYAQLHLIYHENHSINGTNYTGWWYVANRDTTNVDDLRLAYSAFKAKTVIYRYQLLLTYDDEYLLPINTVSNSTATNKTLTTQTFNPLASVYFYNNTNTVNADAVIGTYRIYVNYGSANLSFSFNIDPDLVSNKSVYLVCVPQDGGKATLHPSAPLAQTLPTTEDGYIYKYLGQARNTNTIQLQPYQPCYVYRNGSIQLYVQDSKTVNGHTVEANVPSNAVFTDTNKYHKSGSWSGLTYTATAVNNADELKFTIPTGTSATTVAVGNHTHGNLTNDGKLDNANRLVWTNSSKQIFAGNHYANATKIAINSTTEPSYNLYINGSTGIDLGTEDTTNKHRFVVLGNNRHLSIGGSGIQGYTSSNAASTLNLQYYGGSIQLGNTEDVEITGKAKFTTTNGFTYSGIESAGSDVSRPVWFSHSSATGRPVYNNNFKYNPSTKVLTIGTGSTILASNYLGNWGGWQSPEEGDCFIYRYYMAYTTETAPTEDWYLKVIFDVNYPAVRPVIRLKAFYANIIGTVYMYWDGYTTDYWYAYKSYYNGGNILALKHGKANSRHELYIKMKATREYPSGHFDLGKLEVHSPYQIVSIEQLSTEPEGLTTLNDYGFTFYGDAIELKSARSFNYSGIQEVTSNSSRPIWFSNSSIIGRPVYDNNFKYNASTNVLTIGTGTLSGTEYSGNAATATTATNVAWSGITSNPITFASAAYETTGWKQLGGHSANKSSIVIFKPTGTTATWGTAAHSAVIAWGCGDTKGMLDVAYNRPLVSIAGGNYGGSTDAAPTWYFKLSATSDQTYTFPTSSKTLAAADGSNASGTDWDISITGSSASCTGNAATATSFTSAQKVYVTLGTASTTTTIQGGSDTAQTIGVNGTLAISNGGTGLTSADPHKILIGPASGSAAAPTWRVLAASDLPIATSSAVGGVSVSTGLSVSAAGALTLNIAKYNSLGGLKPAYTSTGAASGFTAASNSSTPALNARTTTTGRYYAVEADKNGVPFVNVNWTDTNTLVNYTIGETTKAYLMASQSAPTSTTTARAAHGDTGVYLTSTAGELSSERYSYNVGGTEKVYTYYNTTDKSIDFVFI